MGLRATESGSSDIDNYKTKLGELLCDTKMLLGALYCHDVFCENHTTDLNEYLDLIIDACTVACDECIPNSRKKGSSRLE